MIRILCFVLFAAAAVAGETVREPELSPTAERMLRAKLRSIRIPRIYFVESTVREAIEFLVVKTKLLNGEADMGMNVNLRLAVSELKDAPMAIPQPAPSAPPNLIADLAPDPTAKETIRRITYRADNVSLEEALDEICRQAKLRWKVDSHGLVITPTLPSKRHHR